MTGSLRDADERDIRLAAAFGQALREYRHWAGLSQRALARAAKVSPGYVSRLERGVMQVGFVEMASFAEVLGCQPSDLVGRAVDIAHRAALAEAGQGELPLSDGEGTPHGGELRRATGHPDRPLVRGLDPGPTRGIRVTTVRYTFELVPSASPRYPRGCTIASVGDAAVIAQNVIGRQPVEVLLVVFLDTRGAVLGFSEVARGTLSGAHVRARDVIQPALLVNAATIVVAHNHPSGNPAPSPADRGFTVTLRAATDLVGLPLLDHVIVTGDRSYSFRAARAWDDWPGDASEYAVPPGPAVMPPRRVRAVTGGAATGKVRVSRRPAARRDPPHRPNPDGNGSTTLAARGLRPVQLHWQRPACMTARTSHGRAVDVFEACPAVHRTC